MFSLSIILSFVSVWCLYAVADRVDFVKTGIHAKLKEHSGVARTISLLSYLLLCILLVNKYGPTTGILVGLMLWTLVGSLIVLFTPFSKFKTLHLGLLMVLIIGLEIFLPIY